jgi:hypothetical protein
MDTHRRRSSHNGHAAASNAAHASSASAAGDNMDAYETSPSPSEIYSGVDLARLAAAGQQQQQLAAIVAAATKQAAVANQDKDAEPQNLGKIRICFSLFCNGLDTKKWRV